MTHEEKDKVIQDYCDNVDDCYECQIKHICKLIDDDFLSNKKLCDDAYKIVKNLKPFDVVSNPSHYCHGGIECIDAMESAFGKEVVKSFCLGNAFKYIFRAPNKNGIEDLDKAIWYINKYKELSAND